MNPLRNVSRGPTRPCSLLVIVLTERRVLVYPAPGSPFVSPAVRVQTPPPCLPRALSSLLLPLLALPLSGSVTIGRGRQTR